MVEWGDMNQIGSPLSQTPRHYLNKYELIGHGEDLSLFLTVIQIYLLLFKKF